jgi:hypothetical protein
METNENKVNNGRVFGMFAAIRNAELKNVRTSEFDDKEMVNRITAYIRKKSIETIHGEEDKGDE